MDLRNSSSGCSRDTPSPAPVKMAQFSAPSHGSMTSPTGSMLTSDLNMKFQRSSIESRHEPLDPNSSSKSGSDESWYEHPSKEVKESFVPLTHQWKADVTIMCLASTNNCIFAGTETGEILVYDLKTYQIKSKLEGHMGSVYNMVITSSREEELLLSVSSDSLVKVWCVEHLVERHSIFSLYDIGDLFSLAWSAKSQVLFVGAQNASIQWVDLFGSKSTRDTSEMPSVRYNKFFDSKQRGSYSDLAAMNDANAPSSSASSTTTTDTAVSSSTTHHVTNNIQIPSENIIRYAHNGYIYCMLSVFHSDRGDLLVSGAGDGTLNVWSIQPISEHDTRITLELIKTVEFDAEILSLDVNQDADLVYVGLEDESVAVFDLDTLQTLQKDFQYGYGGILSLSAVDDCVFRGSEGWVMKWDIRNYQRLKWKAHDGNITSSLILRPPNSPQIYLITGGDDCKVCLWNVSDILELSKQKKNQSVLQNNRPLLDDHNMIRTLRQFVSYQTVSSRQELYMTHCRKGAAFIKNLLAELGAESMLFPVEPNRNPIVYGKFPAETANLDGKKARILFYGHYDVILACDDDQWDTPPFEMTAQNGYLYGRGVSDNKGPVLAAIFAAAEIFHKKKLQNDIVFLIEGEEECGSTGFLPTIDKYLDVIGPIDWILLSNSYWINDTTPCLNYGLRGTVCMDVSITNGKADLHSGVNGGVVREPTIDLVSILSRLVSSDDKIQIAGFYDAVRDVDDNERALYEAIAASPEIEDSIETLMKKWRYPSLTIHNIKSSGPDNSTVIPANVTATLSVRIVPDQDIETIKLSIQSFLEEQFTKLKSPNKLSVDLLHEAPPWVGNPNNEAFQILRNAIRTEWGEEPLFIREGGSIPMVRLLEKTFNAPAAQIPCGQSSDGAHLNNERLRVTNFTKARAILREAFMRF